MSFAIEDCDCTCHPHNGLVKEQRRYQFGEVLLAGRMQPCWCCWCHYGGKNEEEV